MLKPIFVDTSFVIALINQRDQYHPLAVLLANEFENHPLLTSEVVLLEIGNALARKYKQEAITVIEAFLHAEDVTIIPLTHSLFEQGFALYKQYQDKTWSLVDCTSMVIMRKENVRRVLTFDKHFSQAGFEILSPS
ncbi:MAG: PIN domain-containing protein [Caldilineae bacterium]|nr:MAG: PIN domain-containing protein [Caldilineae bacterium]